MNIKLIRLFIKESFEFIKKDIWRVNIKNFTPLKAFFVRLVRVILLAIKSFTEEKIALKASALTFFSLLSLVPVVAMAFGIAKGFGLEKILEKELRENITSQPEVLEKSIEFAHSMLETTKGGVVAGISLLVLFWTIMQMFSNIEESFNSIWKVEKSRSFLRKFTDYLSIMLIAPILLILSSSATVFVMTQLKHMTQEITILYYISPLILFFIKLIPYALIWLLLTLIYMVMPNTKVNFVSALIAGITAGTAYQLTQWVYIVFQIGVSKYNAIYGSFAALPLLLIWLQLSWFIILTGSLLSFSIQNASKYGFDKSTSQLSISFRRLLSLLVCKILIKNFEKGKKPLTILEIAEKITIPERFVYFIINNLVENRIVAETHLKDDELKVYQPAQDINRLSIGYIVEILDNQGINNVFMENVNEFESLKKLMTKFKKNQFSVNEDILLKDIEE